MRKQFRDTDDMSREAGSSVLHLRAYILEEICSEEAGAFDRVALVISCDLSLDCCWILRWNQNERQCLGKYISASSPEDTEADDELMLSVEGSSWRSFAWPYEFHVTSFKGTPNGMLVLKFDTAKACPGSLNDERHAIISVAVNQIGIAIHTADALSVSRQDGGEDKADVKEEADAEARGAVDSERQYRAVLDTIVKDLQSSSVTFEQLFDTCAHTVQNAFQCDRVIIRRVDSEGQVVYSAERVSPELDSRGMPEYIASFLDRLIRTHPQGIAYAYDMAALFLALEEKTPKAASALQFLRDNKWTSVAAAYTYHRGARNGMVVVTFSSKQRWETRDIDLLRTIVTHLSLAIAHTEYVEQESVYKLRLEREVHQVTLLTRLVQEIRSSLDFHTIFQTSARLLADAFDVQRCIIRGTDQSDRKYPICGEHCKDGSVSVFTIPPPPCLNRLVGKLWNYDKAVCVKDVEDDLNCLDLGRPFEGLDVEERQQVRMYYEKLDVKACILHGTKYANKFNGFIVLHSFKPREWTEEEMKLITAVADQIGIALSHATLMENERNRSQVLQKELEWAHVIDVIVADIRMQLDTKHILRTSTRLVAEFFTATRCYICRMNAKLVGEASAVPYDEASQYCRGEAVPLGDNMLICNRLRKWWENPDSLPIFDVFDETLEPIPPEAVEMTKWFRETFGVDVAYAVKISHQGSVNGILVLHMTKGSVLAQEDRAFLFRVVSQVGIALAQAELMESERNRAIALQRSLERSSVLGAVVQAIRSSLDKMEVLETTARLLTQTLGALRCLIQTELPTDDAWRPGVYMEDVAQYVHYNSEGAPSVKGRPLPRAFITNLKSVWFGSNDEAFVVRDISSKKRDPRMSDEDWNDLKTFYESLHATSIIACRCSYMHQPNGVLVVHFGPQAREFAADDLEFVQSVAMQVGIGMHHAHMLQVEKKQRELVAQKNIELEAAKREAENSARAKSDFLSVCTHELRTPMCSVLGFANLLLDTNLDPIQRDYIETILKSGKSLVDLISDILDCGKIEHGKLELEYAAMDVRQVVEGVLDLLSPSAAEKGLLMSYYIDPLCPQSIVSDAKRIRQVLVNLCGNGIKFTDSGEVTIRVMNTTASKGEHLKPGDQCELRITVSDTGRGIKEEDRGKLFLFFQQLDSSKARRFDGAGIGLYLSKTIASLLGGDLCLESTEGCGSSFAFIVRAEVGPYVPCPLHLPFDDQRSGKVLVRIKHAITHSTVIDALVDWGLTVWSPSASEAAGPDAVVFDESHDHEDDPLPRSCPAFIRLVAPATPVRSTSSLSTLSSSSSTTSSVSSSCSSSPAPPSPSSAAYLPPVRCDLRSLLSSTNTNSNTNFTCTSPVHLVDIRKPIRLQSLRDAFAHCLQPPKPPLPPLTDKTPASRQPTVAQPREALVPNGVVLAARCPLQILLAEDHPVNAKIISLMLRKLGYSTSDWVINGLQVLDALIKRRYDVVLLDWQMPDMDGLTALQRITEQYGRTAPYVAMLTANVSASDRNLCLKTGADAFLTKPLNLSELANALSEAYSKVTSGAAS